MIQFQSTHPHGVRHNATATLRAVRKISIHAPAWGATRPSWTPRQRSQNFNPRTRMGCDQSIICTSAISSYFNPRTRMGCDKNLMDEKEAGSIISIHAPAWGATPDIFARTYEPAISIHAPAWGATHRHIRGDLGRRHFNPRTRMGCDQRPLRRSRAAFDFNPRTRMGCDQSIHNGWMNPNDFNPRTRMGCDFAGRSSRAGDILFQSTHPHGVRHSTGHNLGTANSISIHAPAWGATQTCSKRLCLILDFNPRTRMGCDVYLYNAQSSSVISIHAPAWGATRRG